MSDLIDRQDAIDVLNRGLSKIPYVNNTDTEMIRRDERMCCIQEVAELPSVQPEQKWETCFECPLSHGCPKINGCTNGQTMEYASEVPDDCPISVQPWNGKWTRHFDGNEWYWYCSSCKEQWYEEDLWMGGNSFPNFCPNCGCRMEEGDSDD